MDDTKDSVSNWILEKSGDCRSFYRLKFGSNVIGRYISSDFQINSRWVSRKHAEIIVPIENCRYIILRDMKSLNGTFVNDREHRTDTVALKRDDLLGFGVHSTHDNVTALPLYYLRYRPTVEVEPRTVIIKNLGLEDTIIVENILNDELSNTNTEGTVIANTDEIEIENIATKNNVTDYSTVTNQKTRDNTVIRIIPKNNLENNSIISNEFHTVNTCKQTAIKPTAVDSLDQLTIAVDLTSDDVEQQQPSTSTAQINSHSDQHINHRCAKANTKNLDVNLQSKESVSNMYQSENTQDVTSNIPFLKTGSTKNFDVLKKIYYIHTQENWNAKSTAKMPTNIGNASVDLTSYDKELRQLNIPNIATKNNVTDNSTVTNQKTRDNTVIRIIPKNCLENNSIISNEFHTVNTCKQTAIKPTAVDSLDQLTIAIDLTSDDVEQQQPSTSTAQINSHSDQHINYHCAKANTKNLDDNLQSKENGSVDLTSDDEELRQLNIPKEQFTANTKNCADKGKNGVLDVQLFTGSLNSLNIFNEVSVTNANNKDSYNDDIHIQSQKEDAFENTEICRQVLPDDKKSEMANEKNILYLDDFYTNEDFLNEPSPELTISLIDDDEEFNVNDNNKHNIPCDDLRNDVEENDNESEELLDKWSQKIFFSQIFRKVLFSPTRSNSSDSIIYKECQSDLSDLNEENNVLKKLLEPTQNQVAKTPLPCHSEKEADNAMTKERQERNSLSKKLDKNELLQSTIVQSNKRKRMARMEDPDNEHQIETSATISNEKHKPRHIQVIQPLPLKKRRTSKNILDKTNTSNATSLAKLERPKCSSSIKDKRRELLKNLSSKNCTPHKTSNESDVVIKKHPSMPSVKNTTQNRGAFLLDINNAIKPAEALLNRQKNTPKPPLQRMSEEKKPTNNPAQESVITIKNTIKKTELSPTHQYEQAFADCHRLTNQVIRQNAEKARSKTMQHKIENSALTITAPGAAPLPSCLERGQDIATSDNIENKDNINSYAASSTTTTMGQSIVSTSEDLTLGPAIITTRVQKPKKTVRFAAEPIIFYFEPEINSSQLRKVDTKDVLPRLPFKTLRKLIRKNFPTINCIDELRTSILNDAFEFLLGKCNLGQQPDVRIMPFPTIFTSLEHYSSTFSKLLKFELWKNIEQHMKSNSNREPTSGSLIKVTDRDGLLLLETYFDTARTLSCDLVILKIGEANLQTMACTVSSKKTTLPNGLRGSKFVFGILRNTIDVPYLRRSKTLSMEIALDTLYSINNAYFGIHQLKWSPLAKVILNPFKLLKPEYKTPVRSASLNIPKDIIAQRNELNAMQKYTINQIFKRVCLNKTDTTPSITLVQGPVDSGKSVIVVETVLQILYGMDEQFKDKKILICSQNNGAVDEVALKLAKVRGIIKNKQKRFQIVRFGVVNKMIPQVKPLSLKYHVDFERVMKTNTTLKTNFKNFPQFKCYLEALKNESTIIKNKDVELQLLLSTFNSAVSADEEDAIKAKYLDGANVVLATLPNCIQLAEYVNYFDICIIHKATDSWEPLTLLPLQFGISSLILVGDSQQLPAFVLSSQAAKNGLSQSLFTRIQRCIVDDSVNDIIYKLHTQYRLHPEIFRFPNNYFYGNTILNAPHTLQINTPFVPYAVLNLQSTHNFHYVQSKKQSETDFVIELLKEFNNILPTSTNSYSILTPYSQLQFFIQAVRNAGLRNVAVNSTSNNNIHKNDITILYTTRISLFENRLNFVLTRPKKCLIICGNFKDLQSVRVWRHLLEDSKNRNIYHEIFPQDMIDVKNRVMDRLLLKK